jgi:hypothetical protein
MLSNATRSKTRALRRLSQRPTALRAFATENKSPFLDLPQKSNPALLPPYAVLLKKLSLAKQLLNRPLSLAEKILVSFGISLLASVLRLDRS